MNTSFHTSYLGYFFTACIISLCCLNCNTTKTNGDKKEETTDMENKPDKSGHVEDPGDDAYELGDVLPLNNSDWISIPSESLRLKIDKVEDSRCPLNVNCIQAGTAKVHITVLKEDYAYVVDLNAKGLCQKMDGSCGSKVTTQGYTFTLVYLTPYPGEDGKQSVQQDKYVAQVKVEK